MSNEAVLGFIIDVRDKFSSVFSKFNSSIDKIKKNVSSVGDANMSFMNRLNAFGKSFATYVALPMAAAAGYIYKVGSEAKETEMRLTALLRSGEKSRQVLANIGNIKSPVPISEIRSAAISLASSRLSVSEINEELQTFSNLSAVYGVKMEHLADLMSVVWQTKIITKKQLEAFGNIPLYDALVEIAKEQGFSIAQLDKMINKGEVRHEAVDEALYRIAVRDKNLVEAKRKELGGSLTELHNLMIKYADAAFKATSGTNSMGSAIYNLNDKLTNALPDFEDFLGTNAELISQVTGTIAITGAFLALGKAIAALRIVYVALFATTPVGWIMGIIALYSYLYVKFDFFRKLMTNFNKIFIENTLMFLEAIFAPFKAISDIIQFILDKYQAVNSKVIGKAGTMTPLAPKQKLTETPAYNTFMRSENKSTIDVNINAPVGAVGEIKTTGNKNTQVKVGKNLDMSPLYGGAY